MTYVGRPTPKMYFRCIKKRRYRNETHAIAIAAKCMAERPETVLRVYYCQTCQHFHLTSKPTKKDD